jgi:uncharacterized protein (DUF362 family)
MPENSKHSPINRKDFLKTGTLGALGLGLGLPGQRAEAQETKQKRSKVVLARNAEAMTDQGQKDPKVVSGLLKQALCEFTGESSAVKAMKHFVSAKDTVGVKMNVMMTATHPELVAAVARLLVEVGVKEDKIIIWDRDNAGIGVQGAYQREKHYGFGSDSISRIVTEEATVLINIPGLKSHWLSGIAGAIKNWCGAVTRINVRDKDTPFPIHKDSCAEMGMLGALEPIRSKERLVIMDALRPLFEGGPQVNPAYLWHYGGLFLGTDPAAVDRVCLELLNRKRYQHINRPWPVNPPAKHVFLADTRYGLGVSDRSRIDLAAVGEEKDRLI